MGLEFDAVSKGAGKEPDSPGHKHTHDSSFIQLTPTVFISHKELLSYRSSSTSFSDLLKTIGPEIITDGLVNWLATKNNTRSHELISADCYLALSKLLSNYDPKAGLSFLAYSKNLLYSKVVDIWREESNASKAGQVEEGFLEQIQSPGCDPSVEAEGIDLSRSFLSKLPNAERQIVEHRMEGYLYKEIIDRLDQSEASVYRSLNKIRETFDKFNPQQSRERRSAIVVGDRLAEGVRAQVEALSSLRRAVSELATDIDQIRDLNGLATLLEVEANEKIVAKRCIDLGLLEAAASPTTAILRDNGELSLHLDPAVRSYKSIRKNLKQIVAHQGIQLEALSEVTILSAALNCTPTKEGIRRALVVNKIVSEPAPVSLVVRGALNPQLNRRVTNYDEWRFNMSGFLKNAYPTLDSFDRNEFLAEAFNCRLGKVEIARAAITTKSYPWKAPDSFSLFGKRASLYLNRYVMGSESKVVENIKIGIGGQINTLDDVRQNEALSSALRCPKNSTAIAKALVEKGILSGVVPDGHPFTIGQARSNYFDPAVVGAEMVTANVRRFLRDAARTLDDLPMIDALCSTLGVERRRWALAKHLVTEGFIDWRIPPFHDVQIPQGSLYLNREVMSKSQIDFNLKIIFNSTYGGNLDNLPGKSKSLSSALGVANNKGAISKELLIRGIASPNPPDGYDPKSKRQSVYLRGLL